MTVLCDVVGTCGSMTSSRGVRVAEDGAAAADLRDRLIGIDDR